MRFRIQKTIDISGFLGKQSEAKRKLNERERSGEWVGKMTGAVGVGRGGRTGRGVGVTEVGLSGTGKF